ncbi:Hypothetical Protein FCC1311_086242 [Hondaea fermentalgiana]|uniref:SAM domain-containing protein n=1 Tax=Hondaea fermentalgiana TaxID=2315210 RepID=A0A2R5GQ22_9STRA|nr:Hypothetical Protein FCC1311_086242 [Hondaea fermentalgiana]|eukprot:GBG32399.1 Hypothetical Protein FCC1311_086242 [Hondaea fermentalgiana]
MVSSESSEVTSTIQWRHLTYSSGAESAVAQAWGGNPGAARATGRSIPVRAIHHLHHALDDDSASALPGPAAQGSGAGGLAASGAASASSAGLTMTAGAANAAGASGGADLVIPGGNSNASAANTGVGVNAAPLAVPGAGLQGRRSGNPSPVHGRKSPRNSPRTSPMPRTSPAHGRSASPLYTRNSPRASPVAAWPLQTRNKSPHHHAATTSASTGAAGKSAFNKVKPKRGQTVTPQGSNGLVHLGLAQQVGTDDNAAIAAAASSAFTSSSSASSSISSSSSSSSALTSAANSAFAGVGTSGRSLSASAGASGGRRSSSRSPVMVSHNARARLSPSHKAFVTASSTAAANSNQGTQQSANKMASRGPTSPVLMMGPNKSSHQRQDPTSRDIEFLTRGREATGDVFDSGAPADDPGFGSDNELKMYASGPLDESGRRRPPSSSASETGGGFGGTHTGSGGLTTCELSNDDDINNTIQPAGIARQQIRLSQQHTLQMQLMEHQHNHQMQQRQLLQQEQQVPQDQSLAPSLAQTQVWGATSEQDRQNTLADLDGLTLEEVFEYERRLHERKAQLLRERVFASQPQGTTSRQGSEAGSSLRPRVSSSGSMASQEFDSMLENEFLVEPANGPLGSLPHPRDRCDSGNCILDDMDDACVPGTMDFEEGEGFAVEVPDGARAPNVKMFRSCDSAVLVLLALVTQTPSRAEAYGLLGGLGEAATGARPSGETGDGSAAGGAISPQDPVDDVKLEQSKALARIAGVDRHAEHFRLVKVSPRPGESNVRSELSEIVFTFRNVSLETKTTTGEGLPAIFEHLVDQAQKASAAGSSGDDSDNKVSEVEHSDDGFWLRLVGAGDRAQTRVVAEHDFHLQNLWLSLDDDDDGKLNNKENSADEDDSNGEADSSMPYIKVHVQLNISSLAYERTYRVVLSDNVKKGLAGLDLSDWTFVTEPKPDNLGADTLVQIDRIAVYGVGIFVLDVGGVDLRKGVFNADLQIFLLKYHLDFEDVATARREAMHSNRTCKDVAHGERFQFIRGEAAKSLESTFNFINAAAKTVPELVFAHDAVEVFDHFRVRSSWTFSPKVANYPFQDQDMSVQLEIAGQSVTREPTAILCMLETFSGFAQNLSSLALSEADMRAGHPTYTSRFTISEERRWPPLSGNFIPPYRFPHDASIARQPMRTSSRLSWVVSLHRPYIIGALELAPALFVAASALISYFLPLSELRSRLTTCTTSLLAAVVQHSSLRSRIPERAAVTHADLAMLVVYSLILLSMLATVLVSVVVHHRRLSVFADKLNTGLRTFGLLSPLLFLRAASQTQHLYAPLQNVQTTAVVAWSAADVATWVEMLDLPSSTEADRKRYADAFFGERIDGAVLHRLDLGAVRSLRIPLGHSMRIHDSIVALVAGADVDDDSSDVFTQEEGGPEGGESESPSFASQLSAREDPAQIHVEMAPQRRNGNLALS